MWSNFHWWRTDWLLQVFPEVTLFFWLWVHLFSKMKSSTVSGIHSRCWKIWCYMGSVVYWASHWWWFCVIFYTSKGGVSFLPVISIVARNLYYSLDFVSFSSVSIFVFCHFLKQKSENCILWVLESPWLLNWFRVQPDNFFVFYFPEAGMVLAKF